MRSTYFLQLAALAATLALSGCGTPGAPQPPSLNLAQPVGDLAATRAGSQVALTWTMPKKNTDKLLLKGNVAVRVCRKEGAGACEPVGAELSFAPGAGGAFTDSLPSALAAGSPRPLSYFVELRNHNGRSAGLSNAAVVLAGAAPPPVANLTAEVRKPGVVLRWNSAEEPSTAIRLRRKLLTPPAAKPQKGLLTPQPEPLEQSLLVEAGARQTLDKSIRFGQSYEYRAQRLARVALGGKTLELAGPLSAPVRVEAQDIFPPEAPTALAAVATTGDSATQTAIDLSWQPVPDANLAGYIVYRREKVGEADAPWQRISPAEPLLPPAFRDALVQPGHTYRYAVSALGQNGHESPRSAETEETVPNP
jgi:hypothetical protein